MKKPVLKTKTITFFNQIDGLAEKYYPQPAIRFIPEWYKKTAPWLGKTNHPDTVATIKTCVPVLDALTAGYIISTPCDVFYSLIDGEPHFRTPVGQQIIEFHPRKQAHLHPKNNEYRYPKWLNGFGIQTAKGYSCLFVSPLHNPNPWFEILPGLVDTDTYIDVINFPFVMKNPTEECLIPAGTPIVQIIPIKRNDWEHKVSNEKRKVTNVHNFINSMFFNRYKHYFWHRKSYR